MLSEPVVLNRACIGTGSRGDAQNDSHHVATAANSRFARRRELVPDMPAGCELGEVVGVATDSPIACILFNARRADACRVRPRRKLSVRLGRGAVRSPRTALPSGPTTASDCTDDSDHTVRKFTPDGELLLTLGTSGAPRTPAPRAPIIATIQRAGPPFHFPTNVALSPDGDIYVSDGYGNARIHQFVADGRLRSLVGSARRADRASSTCRMASRSIGAGLVYVADRENSRIQRFTLGGQFIDQWTDLARPSEIFIDRAGRVFVAELGYRAGMFAGNLPPSPNASGGRMSIFSPEGELLARWGGGEQSLRRGRFFRAARHLDRFAWRPLCQRSHLYGRHPSGD